MQWLSTIRADPGVRVVECNVVMHLATAEDEAGCKTGDGSVLEETQERDELRKVRQ